eukprot:5885354-Pleurochrysis_carterae.AAC.1
MSGNMRCGASGTPGFSSIRSSVAASSSASHSACARPPCVSGAVSLAACRHPRAAPECRRSRYRVAAPEHEIQLREHLRQVTEPPHQRARALP